MCHSIYAEEHAECARRRPEVMLDRRGRLALTSFFVRLWDTIRTGFWFIPGLLSVAAVGLSLFMVHLDRTVSPKTLEKVGFLYSGGTEGARGVLSTIAGSMITTAGVAFSITIVALALASSQFGPRLLRNFIRDRGNQFVLGTFTATYLYCLLVLRTVVSPQDGARFVPHLAVTAAVVLAVASLVVLIYFIHHIAVTIQAENVVTAVGRELLESIDRLFPEQAAEFRNEGPDPPVSRRQTGSGTIGAMASGYIRAVDMDALIEVASTHGLLLELEKRPGDFVTEGAQLLRISGGRGLPGNVEQTVRDACVIGSHRSQEQDLLFPIHQLAEIAVRALSPGINDPFTAIACVDRLSAGLCRLAGRELDPPVLTDSEGAPRLIRRTVTFADATDAAFSTMRRYGRESVEVTLRLLEAIGEIAPFARTDEQRDALRRHADLIELESRQALPASADRVEVALAHRAAADRLVRRNGSAPRIEG